MPAKRPQFPLVTLTTDFGTRDPYVAAMKGVLFHECPGLHIVDLTHEIGPQALVEVALFVAGAAPYYPSGTIHLVVVDPGVGTDRNAMVVKAGGQIFVCPDNGVLTLFLRQHALEAAHCITAPSFMRTSVSPTFHGRDIFAPAAARLASGEALASAGEVIDSLVTLDLAEAKVGEDGTIRGEVIHVDWFGNCTTNLQQAMTRSGHAYQIACGDLVLPHIHSTYADAAHGAPLALFGSSSLLEIAVRDGSAHRTLGITIGTPVVLSD